MLMYKKNHNYKDISSPWLNLYIQVNSKQKLHRKSYESWQADSKIYMEEKAANKG